MHDLLSEPLISVHTRRGHCRMCLPELLAGLSGGEVEAYSGLRPHQADPWHVFLVQLAASIQARHPMEPLPTDVDIWRSGLLELAGGMATAWHLLVEDVTQPAFLQHPWQSWASEAGDYGVKLRRGEAVYEPKARTPDELDVLVTSRNHDVKRARIGPDEAESWLYALVLLQTTSGFLGQGNYGIVRMNSGSGRRAVVSWSRSLNPSVRFCDEVLKLQEMRQDICQQFGYQSRGVVLTWLTRWQRVTHQYLLTELEPWFIEAARPVRLLFDHKGKLVTLGATSKARQIGPASVDHGVVGDPWTPINVQDKKKSESALSLSAEGFSPQRLTALLFEQGFKLTDLQRPRPGKEVGWFLASCLVRGQGTTEGFHRVELMVPSKARRALVSSESRDAMGQLAQQLLADARDVQRALGTAVTVLTEGGPEKADFDREAVKRWVEKFRADFSRRWEGHFFPALWRGANEDAAVVRREWQQALVNVAAALLDNAVMGVPLPSNRSWRAQVHAHNALRGVLHKHGLPLPAGLSDDTL